MTHRLQRCVLYPEAAIETDYGSQRGQPPFYLRDSFQDRLLRYPNKARHKSTGHPKAEK